MEHNSAGYWLWFFFIGGVIGWLAGLITRGRGFGIIGDVVIGIVGAMLGGWIAGLMRLGKRVVILACLMHWKTEKEK